MPDALIAAYLLCALPFAVPAGAAMRRNAAFPVLLLAAALSLAAFAGLGTVLEDLFQVADAGLTARSVVRSVLACAGAATWFSVFPLPWTSSRAWYAAAFLAALLPPLAFAERERDLRLKRFETLAETGRLVAARRELESAVAVGGPFELGKRTSMEWRTFLSEGIADLEKRMTRGGTPALEKAFQYIQLDRAAEAEAILAGLSDSQAFQLLGALLRDRERWPEAEAAYRKAIRDGAGTWNAFDGLAESLRNQDRADEALAAYAEAAEKVPEAKALATLKRGLLLADEGHSAAALAALEEARRLDPKLAPEIDPRLRSIRANTFQCLPWR